MLIKSLGSAAIVVLMAAGLSTPASARGATDGLRSGSAPTAWSKMTRKKRMMRRKGGGTAAGSAPNGRGTGMGPTGQPSGVK